MGQSPVSSYFLSITNRLLLLILEQEPFCAEAENSHLFQGPLRKNARVSDSKYLFHTCVLRGQVFSSHTVQKSFYPGTAPTQRSPHLGVGHVHAGGVQPVLYLLRIVHLQEIIPTKLHIRQLLVVLKEVDGECHLARCAGCCGEQDQRTQSIRKCGTPTSAPTPQGKPLPD